MPKNINTSFLCLKSNRFYLILIFILSYQIAQAAKVPYKTDTYGCKIGNTVYWDWLGTSTTSGGVTYYNFNPSGDYSDWLNCWDFEYTEEPTKTCRVSGTRGYRGWFWDSAAIPCPIDSEWYILGLGALLSFFFYKRAAILPSI